MPLDAELAGIEIVQVVLTARKEGGFKVMVMSEISTEWAEALDGGGAAGTIAALIREGKWKGVSW